MKDELQPFIEFRYPPMGDAPSERKNLGMVCDIPHTCYPRLIVTFPSEAVYPASDGVPRPQEGSMTAISWAILLQYWPLPIGILIVYFFAKTHFNSPDYAIARIDRCSGPRPTQKLAQRASTDARAANFHNTKRSLSPSKMEIYRGRRGSFFGFGRISRFAGKYPRPQRIANVLRRFLEYPHRNRHTVNHGVFIVISGYSGCE